MKKLNVGFVGALLVAMCTLLTFSSSVEAQDPPIGSPDVARNHMLSKVRRGYISLQSPSMDYSYEGAVISAEVVGGPAEQVLAKLGEVVFLFRLTNPEDLVTGWVYLYDINDNLLFYGNTQFKVTDLASGKPKYDIWPHTLPLFFSAKSAQVLALNPDGTTGGQVYDLQVNDKGQVLFSHWMAGIENGLLVVKWQDGSVTSYRLTNPKKQSPTLAEEQSEFTIRGHHVLKDPTEIKILALWDRPTVFVEFTRETEVRFDVAGVVQKNGGVEFERPVSMEYSGPMEVVIDLASIKPMPQKIIFPKGSSFRLSFTWGEFGKPGLLYTGPSDGGKG